MKKNNYEDIKKEISSYKYVSFDIFDTLINRNTGRPTDLFLLMEHKLVKQNEKFVNYKNKRIDAEKVARLELKKEEILLEDIYKYLNYSNHEKKYIYDLEIKLEEELCSSIKRNVELLNYCLKKGKKVILTSDMYLPKDIIQKILKKNNINYYKLYLSSDVLLTKESGCLFKYILDDLKIKNNEIIHLGDNYYSDYDTPMMLGIKAINLKIERKKYHFMRKEDIFAIDCLNSFINNNLSNEDNLYFQKGYESFGPLLYGYSKWLDNSFNKDKIDNIYFLSRDGYLMQKAFNIISNKKSEYMYASRRALIVPTLWKYKNLDEIKKNINFPREFTLNSFFKKIGLDVNNYKKLLEKNNFNISDKILYDNLSEEYLSFFKDIKKDIVNNSKIEYNNFLNYIKRLKMDKKCAIVDIGWHGNMQYAFDKILKMENSNISLYGYYVGIVPTSDKQSKLKMSGYLFDKNDPMLFYKEVFFNSLFELIFLAPHGSVKKYTDINDVELYAYEYKDENSRKKIESFQNGALKFVEDFNSSNISKYIELNNYVAFYNMLEFGNYPSIDEINMFKDIVFYDDEIYNLVEVDSIVRYFLNPVKLFKNFRNSIWKVAFLKKIFKFEFRYFDFLEFIMKKKYKK